jgi:hypothetical protein
MAAVPNVPFVTIEYVNVSPSGSVALNVPVTVVFSSSTRVPSVALGAVSVDPSSSLSPSQAKRVKDANTRAINATHLSFLIVLFFACFFMMFLLMFLLLITCSNLAIRFLDISSIKSRYCEKKTDNQTGKYWDH